jgi:prophage regulatory protein
MSKRQIMRLPKVMEATGLGRSSIYNKMEEGDFPKSRRISLRAVGWDSLEIEAWVKSKLDATKEAEK